MSGMVLTKPKRSDETRRLRFDFISALAVDEAISSATVAVSVWSGLDPAPAALLSGSASVNGTGVEQLVTGGYVGTIYKLVCTATTDAGQAATLVTYLPIVNEPLSGVAPGSQLPATSGTFAEFMFTKASTLVAPQVGDSLTILHAPAAVRLVSIMSLLSGGTAPEVSYNVYYGSNRNTGTLVVTAGITVDSTTTGDEVTSFDNGTIPAGAFLWLEVTAVSGAPDELNVTFQF